MKIIYLSNARIPTEKAHGSQIMKMCESFARQGAEVELILPRRANEIKEDPFDFYRVARIFRITYIFCLDQESMKFLPEKLSFSLQKATFYLSARSYLLFKKYDYLYSREQAAALWFRKAVIELHSLPAGISQLDVFIWRRVFKFIALTKFIGQGLVDHGINESDMMVAGDAADLEAFARIAGGKAELRNELNLPGGKKIIGYIGKYKTMGMDKGVGLLIKAFARVSAARDDCLLLLVGLNPEEIGEVDTLCRQLSIKPDRYRLLGHAPQTEAFKFMKACDLLAMAYPNITHYAYYMSPLKLFEYMASGTPIMSTGLPSIREILNENNSILAAPDSESELVRGLESAMADPDKLSRLAIAARADVERHTWLERAKRIINFING